MSQGPISPDFYTSKIHLKDLLRRGVQELLWCSGSNDFAPGGQARLGWERGPMRWIAEVEQTLKASALEIINEALDGERSDPPKALTYSDPFIGSNPVIPPSPPTPSSPLQKIADAIEESGIAGRLLPPGKAPSPALRFLVELIPPFGPYVESAITATHIHDAVCTGFGLAPMNRVKVSKQPSALLWTREKPKVAGWYWVRDKGMASIVDLWLNRTLASLYVSIAGDEGSTPLSKFSDWCEWWGPLPEPGDPSPANLEGK